MAGKEDGAGVQENVLEGRRRQWLNALFFLR